MFTIDIQKYNMDGWMASDKSDAYSGREHDNAK